MVKPLKREYSNNNVNVVIKTMSVILAILGKEEDHVS